MKTTTATLAKALPSNFMSFPMGSVLKNHESEVIARNIMAILNRTGNTFRELTWEEYSKERKKDGNFSEREKGYFDDVIKYCKSADTAVCFCEDWYKA